MFKLLRHFRFKDHDKGQRTNNAFWITFILLLYSTSFINKDDLDFDNVESTVPTQEWDLVEDTHGQVAEYSTRYPSLLTLPRTSGEKMTLTIDNFLQGSVLNQQLTLSAENNINRVAKFSSIRSLTLFFSENFGGDTTKISFIGLKGEFSEASFSRLFSLFSLLTLSQRTTTTTTLPHERVT